METFTKTNLTDEFLKDIDEALAVVAEKHGVDFESVYNSGTRFSARTITMKLNAAIIGKGDGTTSAEQVTWNQTCDRFGLSPDDFGKTFMLRDMLLTVVGINPRAKKYPVLVQTAAGRTHKIDARTVKLNSAYTAKIS